ncbi:transposable element Tc1 transposase [Trichonephila clavipes]|nr:transposable element Tc1 transposase [Trichonephila clavipes]
MCLRNSLPFGSGDTRFYPLTICAAETRHRHNCSAADAVNSGPITVFLQCLDSMWVAARVQRNSSTITRVSKQWTDEGRTAWKSESGPRNVTSARDDRRLVRMAQTGRTASSRQLAAQWSTATGVSLCA